MRAPNGVDYPMGGEFRAIVAPERVVFMCGPVDDKGNFLFQFLHTAAFIERNGQTEMTLRSRVINTTPEAKKYIAGFETGMSLSLDRLAETLASKGGPLVIERVYDAPAALVWQAFTNRDKISLWSFKMAEFRPEVGFEFEFYGEKNGVKYFHHCKIMEVIPEKKLAYTWRYLGHEGDSLVTFELFAEGAKTRLKLTHAGLETFPQTADFARGNFLEGWTHILGSSLKEFLEKKQ
jgi:uncharacterized protein YndB with AHSA1/START domain